MLLYSSKQAVCVGRGIVFVVTLQSSGLPPASAMVIFAIDLYHWCELPQVSFLSRQNTSCRDKTFVTAKIMFVATKLLSRQTRVCRDKHTFLMIKDAFLFVCFSHDKHMFDATKFVVPNTLIAWLRKALKEEALDDLHWKDEREPSSVRQTLKPFQRQRWENWETGWSAYGLFRAHRYTILNCCAVQNEQYAWADESFFVTLQSSVLYSTSGGIIFAIDLQKASCYLSFSLVLE